MSRSKLQDRLAGVLYGTAVGDSLGLPAEGLSPTAIANRGWRNHWKHRLLPSHGMWSDDTEHTIMLSQALLQSRDDVHRFQAEFSKELRCWLIGLPAGVGLATARAILKLCLGISPKRSGVFSAGNGPCMRAAIIGVYFAEDPKLRKAFTQAQTKITHNDPKAFIAANAVSGLAALFTASETVPNIARQISVVQNQDSDSEWEHHTEQLEASLSAEHGMHQFLSASGINSAKGIGGYAYHTVPAVLFAGMKHQWAIEPTLTELFNAGGDTDTTGAIAGALCGALHGAKSIPHSWIEGIHEWPTCAGDLDHLAIALTEGSSIRIRPYWSLSLVLRNLYFLAIVLSHGLLRPLVSLSSKFRSQHPISQRGKL